MSKLFTTTLASRRHITIAVIVGIIAGIIGNFVKMGWESMIPPRTPDRLAPPLVMFQQLHIPYTHLTYYFSGVTLNWSSRIIPFGFSIAMAIIYVVLAEYFPRVKYLQGIFFGIAVWIVFHLIVVPALHESPATWNLPLDENISEFLGHILWIVAIEQVRRGVRARLTHEPDPEIPLPGESAPAPAVAPAAEDKPTQAAQA